MTVLRDTVECREVNKRKLPIQCQWGQTQAVPLLQITTLPSLSALVRAWRKDSINISGEFIWCWGDPSPAWEAEEEEVEEECGAVEVLFCFCFLLELGTREEGREGKMERREEERRKGEE